MKVAHITTVSRAALCGLLLLTFSACNVLPSNDAANTASTTPAPGATSKPRLTEAEARTKLDEARKALEDAQAKTRGIEKLKATATTLRAKANEARKDADAKRALTEGQGKDPENPDQSPVTYKAIQAWRKADGEAVDAQRKVEELEDGVTTARGKVASAEQALRDAQQGGQPAASSSPAAGATPVGQPADAPAAGDNTSGWLPLLLGALTLLTIANGVLGFMLYKKVRGRVERVRYHQEVAKGDLNALTNDLRGWHHALSEKVNALPSAGKLAALQTTVDKLENLVRQTAGTVETIRQTPRGGPGPNDYAGDDGAAVAAARRNVIEFPITAENYFDRVRGDLVPVRHDDLRRMLVRADDGEGTMYLVNDGSAGNMSHVVPQLKRFTKRAEYDTHYSDYFELPNPAGGEITIIRPAVVFRDPSGGWQLHQRGELKV